MKSDPFNKTYFTSGNYKTYEEDTLSWAGTFAKNICRMLPKKKELNILEVGCTFGYLLKELQESHKCAVQGLEYSAFAVQHAKKEVRTRVRQGNVLEGNTYKKNQFDAVVCIDVCEYLERKEIGKAIRNMIAWTKNLIFFTDIYTHSRSSSEIHNPDLLRKTTMTKKEYIRIFESIGTKLIRRRNFGNGSEVLIFQKKSS